ncbi:MAG: hypothetical protein R3242_02690 [Akkermansiaceae bacterium]|nr:hypothetical protein [Akkermansiaceae bacterium]
MDIYVGNLPYSTTEEELGDLFAAFGPVKRTTIIKDRETGRSKGFGFVVLEDESQVEGAIEAINGSELGGRVLKANASEPKPRFQEGGGGGGNRSSAYKGGDKTDGYKGKGGHKGKGKPKGKEHHKDDYGDDDFRPQRGGKPKGKHREKRRRNYEDGDDDGW